MRKSAAGISMIALNIVIAMVVYFMLSRPAVTRTLDPHCGLDEHTHGDECYELVLDCEINIHRHGGDCYSSIAVCGIEEHTHFEACYAHITPTLTNAQGVIPNNGPYMAGNGDDNNIGEFNLKDPSVPYIFEVGENEISTAAADGPGHDIPDTGGSGVLIYWVVGMLLMVMSLASIGLIIPSTRMQVNFVHRAAARFDQTRQPLLRLLPDQRKRRQHFVQRE